MLYITKKEENCDILDIESYFKVVAINNDLFDNDKCKDAMKKIDNADYLGNGVISTPLGTTSIQDLSTGCKTILLILINSKQKDLSVLSVLECGDNAIEYIFNLAKDIDINIYLNRGISLSFNSYNCIIDGKEICNTVKIFNELEEYA